MILTTKDLFQYFWVFLVLLWPVWVFGFVFLRWLLQKTGLFSGNVKAERPAAFQEKGQSKPVEPIIGTPSSVYLESVRPSGLREGGSL